MRIGWTLAPLLVVSLTLSAASAQPRRGRAKAVAAAPAAKPAKAPAKASAAPPKELDAAPAPPLPAPAGSAVIDADAPAEPASSSAASDDLGEPPPPSSDAPESVKPSPLNPAPNEFPSVVPAPAPVDFDRLLGDIAALRSRVSALTTTLFKSKLRVVIEARGDEARIEALAVTLDDGVVFAAPQRFNADDKRVVYEHAVAPGQHVVGLDIERYDARKREYRTWQSSKFAVVVPESQLVEARFVLDDDSEMASDFPEDQDGEYDLRVRLRAIVNP